MPPVEPRQVGENERSGAPDDKNSVVIVWVCPNCGNYYGSSTLTDEAMNSEVVAASHAKNPGEVKGHRYDCPQCKTPRRKRFARLISVAEEQEIRKQVTAAMAQKGRLTRPM